MFIPFVRECINANCTNSISENHKPSSLGLYPQSTILFHTNVRLSTFFRFSTNGRRVPFLSDAGRSGFGAYKDRWH